MIRSTGKNNTNWESVTGGLLATLLTVSLAGCGEGGNATNVAATNTITTNTTANANVPATANTTVGDSSFKDASMSWGRVEEARARLDKVVMENSFDGVHDAAVGVRDAVTPLPGQSGALPPEKREKLAAEVKTVERMVGMLDEVVAAKNTSSMHEHHTLVNASLDAIKALYPAGVMAAGMSPDDGMGDKSMPGMDQGMMHDGMEMMGKGMGMTNQGKDMVGKSMEMMDKEMMDKGMDMMEEGMDMMDKAKDVMDKGKPMNDKMPMKKKDDKKMNNMGHM